MSTTRSKNTPFWLLLVGVVLILMCNALLTEGMFLDGVTYAGISRNMAEGLGTFWNPHYTQTLYPEFRQHPPLALGMEALFFKALGDHLYVEKLFSVLTFLFSGLLLALIWKRTTNHLRYAWLPLLFWVTMPLVTWSAVNNMLENTMTVFVLLSVWLMLLYYQKDNKLWLFLSGISLFAAFLSKGFTGLFPLTFPIIYCIFDDQRRWIQGTIDSILLVITMAVLLVGMFLVFPASFTYLKEYVNHQVIDNGMHEVTVNTRFYIVSILLMQLVVPVVIFTITLIISKLSNKRKKQVFASSPNKKMFLIFLVLGLTGVLPIMISVKQRSFYMLAALPFFSLALGHLTIPVLNGFTLKIKPRLRKWMTIGSSCVLLTGLVLNVIHIGKYGRDELFLKEMKSALRVIPENEIVAIDSNDYSQWLWHAYFMRYGKVSLDDRQPHQYHFPLQP